MISGRYPDDHVSYHGHGYHRDHKEEEVIDDDDSSEETDLSEKDQNQRDEDGQEDIIPEVRDGIADERDVEAGPALEKSKTTRSGRSARDPNLVAWDGPDDPENPKNWTMKRKWAATVIGKWLFYLT
jgi:hypothetical protein